MGPQSINVAPCVPLHISGDRVVLYQVISFGCNFVSLLWYISANNIIIIHVRPTNNNIIMHVHVHVHI
jgi:hypothetical protein